ncbi:hypothetical protein LRAMOSA05410 [Lichtheimia ramosa]|uniref:EamA domain-containing protein n=1 Tax=Lichtheimia ramosa TaxID=688394 RepID=A0A077X2G6_9FUNG|nr:hypothetical protein LRAMOSA05410 [Lichtheimia ramosa]
MGSVYTLFLTLGLLASGVSIPLILTFQNHQPVNQSTNDPPEYFAQPLLQTAMIFLGEIVCILAIQVASKTPVLLDRSLLQAVAPQQQQSNQQPSQQQQQQQQQATGGYGDHPDWAAATSRSTSSWALTWFIVPSACDLIATTLMNLGLVYSTASIFQMVRSSIVGFSAIFSLIFLSRRFLGHEWGAVAAILIGTTLICMQDDWVGPAYLCVAQLFVAGQFVLEEYLMDRYRLDPVKAMGIEGAFGTVLLVIALGVATAANLGDMRQGMTQLFDHYVLWQSALVLALMVAMFNFFGLAVSSSVGVPGRSVIDTFRTVLIWVIAIHYGWDTFSWLQLAGFVVLVLGVFVFNGVFSCVRHYVSHHASGNARNGESAPLLS